MRHDRFFARLTCATAALAFGAAFAFAQAGGDQDRQRQRKRDLSCVEPVSPATLENLQAAYAGESNARGRYTAFARKADEDGYGAGRGEIDSGTPALTRRRRRSESRGTGERRSRTG